MKSEESYASWVLKVKKNLGNVQKSCMKTNWKILKRVDECRAKKKEKKEKKRNPNSYSTKTLLKKN